MKKHLFKGCGTALITPFNDDGTKVDFEAFEKLLNFQLENGADALIVAGTTGESPVLSKQEKAGLFERAVKTANGRIPVIAGTGSNCTEQAVKKANDAEKQGVDGLLIVTPYYNKATQEGIVKHYEYISDRVNTPIIVYNVPSRTGLDVKPETYLALSELKNICAIKEANGDISQCAKTMQLCRGLLDVYSGNDDQTVAMLSLGSKGVISVASNIIPEIMHTIVKAYFDGNTAFSSKLFLRYLDLMKQLFCEVNPIPIKAAAAKCFGFSEKLRLPLTEITQGNRQALENTLRSYNLIK